jgi:hypothetical protein
MRAAMDLEAASNSASVGIEFVGRVFIQLENSVIERPLPRVSRMLVGVNT